MQIDPTRQEEEEVLELQGKAPTPEGIAHSSALVIQASRLARQVVERVARGSLTTVRSAVIEDHLFVNMGDDTYMVFSPNGEIGLSGETSLTNVTWTVPTNWIEDISNSMGKWLA